MSPKCRAVIILDELERGAFDKVRRINAYIAKNRSGGLGAVHLLFHPSTMTFTLAPEETKE